MSVQLWKLLKRNKFNLKGTQWTLVGYSRCARNTFFYIPELNIALDAGLATDLYPTHIFITHAHMDHIGELFRYVIDPPNNLIPCVYYPKPSKDFIDEFIQSSVKSCVESHIEVETFVEASISMTKHAKTKIPWRPIGVSIKKDHPADLPIIFSNIKIKNFKFKLELFKSTHTIATTGYGFIECRHALKPEFRHLIGNQEAIDELKKNNVEISKEYEYAHFCYLGDTDHNVLYSNSGGWNTHLEKYSTIIVECTFFEECDAKQAKNKKHMLLSNLLPFINAHPEINFMLCHFSMKYKDKEITDFFERLAIPNIIPIINDIDNLETDAVCDLIKENNEYSTNAIVKALEHVGYVVNKKN